MPKKKDSVAPPASGRHSQSDIARACGVSRSAVAAVLGGGPTTTVVGVATRARILAAARRLGYGGNAAARALRSGRTHAVALAIPYPGILRAVIPSQILQGIVERTQQTGYTVHLCTYHEAGDLRGSLLRTLQESRVDGVFFHAEQRAAADPREAMLRASGVPFVALHKQSSTSSSVDFDHIGGARQAVAHLVRKGRRRIAFVGDQPAVAYAEQRKAGYMQALCDAGIPVDPALILSSSDDYAESGRRAVMQIVRSGLPCDALFCTSDVAALTAIQELGAHNLRVPGDVAVVGYDDSEPAAWATPALTSVRQDGIEMGRQAVDMLLHRIAQPAAGPELRVLPVQLVVRASCGGGK